MSAHPILQSIGELERLGAILAIQDGNHGEKHPVSADYVESGIPFIMARDISDGTVNLRDCKFLRKEQADSLRIGFARKDDVLLTHKGTVGAVAIVPRIEAYVMLTPQVTYYRLEPTKLNNKYFSYALREPVFQDRLKSVSSQSTRPYVGITAQRDLRVLIHPLPTQRKIAAILSAYDDLIENNLRRIKILEEMAQNLYREWFVKFRFPGHQHARFVDSPLGRIPEGWEVKSISDVAIIHRGRSYKGTELANEGGRPFINLKCIERDGGFRSSGLKRYTGPFKDAHTVRAGGIVMAITDMTQERRIVARVGRVSRLDADFGVISMDLVRVASRGKLSETYLYAI